MMSDAAKAPVRLTPFYETPEPGKEILLVEEDDATLKQDGAELKGKLRVTQQWSPMGLYWEFEFPTQTNFEFGDAEIVAKSFVASARIFSKGQRTVAGHIEGQVVTGTDHKLSRVTFHLPDYPDLIGEQCFDDEITDGTRTTSIRWSEVVLEADGWRVVMQPFRDYYALRQKGRAAQKVVLSGVGEIRRSDGAQFKRKEVQPLLEALRIFLSFAFAEWSPPLLAVGSNEVAQKSCQFWGNYDVAPRPLLQGWLDEHHGPHLAAAFPGFMALWTREKWREPLLLTVSWLIEASRQSGGVDGGIAFGQIPLEMLAWLAFVDDRAIVESEEFKNLSAASKMQLLLAQCGIPLGVPTELTALAKVAAEMQRKSGKAPTGPQLVTKVRNTIIHPNDQNRRVRAEWESNYSVSWSDIRWETYRLFKWYITLVLLRHIGYSGKYANRLTHRKIGQVEPVPWAVL